MLFELNTFLGLVNVLNWVTTVEMSAENIFHSNFVLKTETAGWWWLQRIWIWWWREYIYIYTYMFQRSLLLPSSLQSKNITKQAPRKCWAYTSAYTASFSKKHILISIVVTSSNLIFMNTVFEWTERISTGITVETFAWFSRPPRANWIQETSDSLIANIGVVYIEIKRQGPADKLYTCNKCGSLLIRTPFLSWSIRRLKTA